MPPTLRPSQIGALSGILEQWDQLTLHQLAAYAQRTGLPDIYQMIMQIEAGQTTAAQVQAQIQEIITQSGMTVDGPGEPPTTPPGEPGEPPTYRPSQIGAISGILEMWDQYTLAELAEYALRQGMPDIHEIIKQVDAGTMTAADVQAQLQAIITESGMTIGPVPPIEEEPEETPEEPEEPTVPVANFEEALLRLASEDLAHRIAQGRYGLGGDLLGQLTDIQQNPYSVVPALQAYGASGGEPISSTAFMQPSPYGPIVDQLIQELNRYVTTGAVGAGGTNGATPPVGGEQAPFPIPMPPYEPPLPTPPGGIEPPDYPETIPPQPPGTGDGGITGDPSHLQYLPWITQELIGQVNSGQSVTPHKLMQILSWAGSGGEHIQRAIDAIIEGQRTQGHPGSGADILPALNNLLAQAGGPPSGTRPPGGGGMPSPAAPPTIPTNAGPRSSLEHAIVGQGYLRQPQFDAWLQSGADPNALMSQLGGLQPRYISGIEQILRGHVPGSPMLGPEHPFLPLDTATDNVILGNAPPTGLSPGLDLGGAFTPTPPTPYPMSSPPATSPIALTPGARTAKAARSGVTRRAGGGSLVVNEPSGLFGFRSGRLLATMGERTRKSPQGVREKVAPIKGGVKVTPFQAGGTIRSTTNKSLNLTPQGASLKPVTLFPKPAAAPRPSNNVQPLFEQNDPYRKAPMTDTGGALVPQDLWKDPLTGTISPSPVMGTQPPGVPGQVPGNVYTANAARLLGGAVARNPFLTRPARTGLSAGNIPRLNQIDPAFWKHTTPSVSKAMLGLYESIGRPREDVLFTSSRWRPPSYR